MKGIFRDNGISVRRNLTIRQGDRKEPKRPTSDCCYHQMSSTRSARGLRSQKEIWEVEGGQSRSDTAVRESISWRGCELGHSPPLCVRVKTGGQDMLQRRSESTFPAQRSRRGAVAWDQRLDIKEGSSPDFPLPRGLTLHPLCIIWSEDSPSASDFPCSKGTASEDGTSVGLGHEEAASGTIEGDKR